MTCTPARSLFSHFVALAIFACFLSCNTVFADGIHTASDIKGALLVPLGTLPHSPENGLLDDYCTGYRAKKLSAVGRQVAKLGWIVTSEAPLGRYHVITFASGFTPGTSAICFARNANIGVFDGARLVALAYTSHKAGWQLGVAEPQESGTLLIWGGDGPGEPAGELRQENDGLRLTKVAAKRTFCGGRAVVPDVYGKHIDAARKVLIAHGWRPLRPHEKPVDGDAAAELAKRGVIEAETCSGTGVGYCAFEYRNTVGVLGVTTVGGDPEPGGDNFVVDYNVSCRAK